VGLRGVPGWGGGGEGTPRDGHGQALSGDKSSELKAKEREMLICNRVYDGFE
jgi:hypothetical protein